MLLLFYTKKQAVCFLMVHRRFFKTGSPAVQATTQLRITLNFWFSYVISCWAYRQSWALNPGLGKHHQLSRILRPKLLVWLLFFKYYRLFAKQEYCFTTAFYRVIYIHYKSQNYIQTYRTENKSSPVRLTMNTLNSELCGVYYYRRSNVQDSQGIMQIQAPPLPLLGSYKVLTFSNSVPPHGHQSTHTNHVTRTWASRQTSTLIPAWDLIVSGYYLPIKLSCFFF